MDALNNTIINNNKNFASLGVKTKQLSAYITNLSHVVNNVSSHNLFVEQLTEAVVLFELLTNYLYHFQDNFVEVLVDAHRGVLRPFLLSPTKLIEELKRIQNLIHSDLAFPFNIMKHNSHDLYKTLRLTVFVHDNTVQIIVRVPLVNREMFRIIKVTSVPTNVKDNVFVYIAPTSEYLVLSNNKQLFFEVDSSYVRSCVELSHDLICKQQTPILFVNTNTNCALNMFLNEILTSSCEKKFIKLNNAIFVNLETKNSWMYATANPITIQIKCTPNDFKLTLSQTGILKMKSFCIASTSSVLLNSFGEIDINFFNLSFIPKINLKNLLFNETLQFDKIPDLNNTLVTYNLGNLHKFSASLHILRKTEKSLTKHDIHNYAVNYTTVILIVLAIFMFIGYLSYLKRKRNNIDQNKQLHSETIYASVSKDIGNQEPEIGSNPSYKFLK
ncbi:uncharacterized protein [Onthophagus taurus]|uniref:uncharacterized protein n=1 Tax=Onthophagus taurus TaxID=166361 RepID=UPI0039BDEBD4